MVVDTDIIVRLLEELGVDQSSPDDEGTWSLRIGEDLLLLMRITPDRSALMLSVPIGMLEDDPSNDTLRDLLEATTYWFANAAVALGLVPGASTILLSTRLEPEILVPDRFLERLEQFMSVSGAWREQLAEAGSPAEGAVAQEAPPHAAEPGDKGGFHDFA